MLTLNSLVPKSYQDFSSSIQECFGKVSEIVNGKNLPWLDVYTIVCLDFDSVIESVISVQSLNMITLKLNGDSLETQKNNKSFILSSIIAQLSADIERKYYVTKDNRFTLEVCNECCSMSCDKTIDYSNTMDFIDSLNSADIQSYIMFTLKMTVYNDFGKWS